MLCSQRTFNVFCIAEYREDRIFNLTMKQSQRKIACIHSTMNNNNLFCFVAFCFCSSSDFRMSLENVKWPSRDGSRSFSLIFLCVCVKRKMKRLFLMHIRLILKEFSRQKIQSRIADFWTAEIDVSSIFSSRKLITWELKVLEKKNSVKSA